MIVPVRLFFLEIFWTTTRSGGGFKDFSPTAIALGFSAIVKVSEQNCFRTLYSSLGQIRFGVPKGSVEGSPITSLNWSPTSATLSCILPQQRWSSAKVKVLGQNDTFVF